MSVPILDEFPSLFDGKMGKISGVTIINLHIESSVPPVTQYHNRIPFHVRKDVEAELKRLREMNVIEEVTGPTPLVVPKKNKGVCVCIDMRKANEAIQWIKNPMLTMDDLIAGLNGSTVFSKLDLSNAYHQLELGESSWHITTFATHAGLFRYKRLLFRASELFPKAISDLLRGIPAVKNLSDNIIIYGHDQISHDSSLRSTLECLQNAGARLNREKCLFSVWELIIFGHIFSENGVPPDPEKVSAIVKFTPPLALVKSDCFLAWHSMWRDSSHTMPLSVKPLRQLTRKDAE